MGLSPYSRFIFDIIKPTGKVPWIQALLNFTQFNLHYHTNVIAYFWIPGSYTRDAEQLLQADPEWKVPLLWKSEFRNVLINYIRHELLTLDVALQVISDAEAQLKDHEFSVISSDVLKLSSDSKCTAYDCEFVALADDLRLPLITTDKKILSEFPSVALSIADYLDRQNESG